MQPVLIFTADQENVKLQPFSGSDLSTCVLATFYPLRIWVISLEICEKPSILEADNFLGECCRNAMTPPPKKKTMDFTLSPADWHLVRFFCLLDF